MDWCDSAEETLRGLGQLWQPGDSCFMVQWLACPAVSQQVYGSNSVGDGNKKERKQHVSLILLSLGIGKLRLLFSSVYFP